MRTFKDNQLGKKCTNIEETVGTDLQTLTENDVFRFPSTFTFIFRSFASIGGIGKGLSDTASLRSHSSKSLQECKRMIFQRRRAYTWFFQGSEAEPA